MGWEEEVDTPLPAPPAATLTSMSSGLGVYEGDPQLLDLFGPDYSLSKDGVGYMALSGKPTTMTASTTPADEDSFMSFLHDTVNHTTTNSITNGFDFQLDEYNHSRGKESQLVASPPSPTTISIVRPSPTATYASSDVVSLCHFAKTPFQSAHKACASIIIDMIHAYPRMMLRRETFPPFVHAYSPTADTEDDANRLPLYLTNCMGIAQLFAVCNNDTRPFVWATIRAEMRGFKSRMSSWDKYEALSATQASLLYLIMRADDDAPQEAKDDYEMLKIHAV